MNDEIEALLATLTGPLKPVSSLPPFFIWGFMVLFFLISLLGLWCILKRKRFACLQMIKNVERQLDGNIPSTKDIIIISEILKRAALIKFNRTDVASLTGKAWLEFLDANSKNPVFIKSHGTLLSDIMYQKNQELTLQDFKSIVQSAKLWVKYNL